jgi:hypothetical protein
MEFPLEAGRKMNLSEYGLNGFSIWGQSGPGTVSAPCVRLDRPPSQPKDSCAQMALDLRDGRSQQGRPDCPALSRVETLLGLEN